MKASSLLFLAAAAAAFDTVSASAESAVTLAQWTFETSAPASSGSFAPETGAGSASAFHTSASTAYSSPAGNGSAHSFSSNNWSVGDYYQFKLNTTGYEAVAVKWDQTSSNTGPKDFKLQYSTDGAAFTDLTSYSVLANASPNTPWSATGSVNSAYTLTEDLAAISGLNNQASVTFRLVLADTTPAGASATFGSGGTDRIDNFTVTGAVIPEPSTYAVLLGLASLGFVAWRRKR